MSLVLDAARRAFDAIPLYRSLYGSRPERDEDVPFLSISAFHRAATPVDMIVSTETVRGVVPAYSRGVRRLPVSVLESEAEWKLRLERLRHALSILGATPSAGSRFAIVADEATGPFASDIANFLAWDRAECSVVFQWDGPERIAASLAALAPDVVIVAGARAATPWLKQSGARLVTCVHADNAQHNSVEADRLLVSDELFVIGTARAGEATYEFDKRSILVESDPASGRMAVTTTAFDCLALIRYCLELPPLTTGAGPHARL